MRLCNMLKDINIKTYKKKRYFNKLQQADIRTRYAWILTQRSTYLSNGHICSSRRTQTKRLSLSLFSHHHCNAMTTINKNTFHIDSIMVEIFNTCIDKMYSVRFVISLSLFIYVCVCAYLSVKIIKSSLNLNI